IRPHVERPVARTDAEGELLARLAAHDGAGRPVDRAFPVAFHVAPELRAYRGTGRAVDPFGLERLRAVAADLGDVAHEVPDLGGGCAHVDGDGVVHGAETTRLSLARAEELVEADGEVADAHAGCVPDRVRDRRGRADDADLADALGPGRPEVGFVFVDP